MYCICVALPLVVSLPVLCRAVPTCHDPQATCAEEEVLVRVHKLDSWCKGNSINNYAFSTGVMTCDEKVHLDRVHTPRGLATSPRARALEQQHFRVRHEGREIPTIRLLSGRLSSWRARVLNLLHLHLIPQELIDVNNHFLRLHVHQDERRSRLLIQPERRREGARR